MATRRGQRDGTQRGSALTEFVIVLPLFVLLVYWAQFFTDLGIFKLKTEEAARFAVWEFAAQRSPADIDQDLRAKFLDLSSPDDRRSTTGAPYGTLSFPRVEVAGPIVFKDDLDTAFDGRLARPTAGGLLGSIQRFFVGFFNWGVARLLDRYGLNTKGEATATVTLRAPNTLFPGGSVLGLFFDDGGVSHVQATASTPPLMVDVWEAWPGRYALAGKDVSTAPDKTYGRGSPPEKEVAAHMRRMAYFGLTSLLKPVDIVLKFAKLPGIDLVDDWGSRGGPVAMLPGAVIHEPWRPGFGGPVQRIGDQTRDDTKVFKGIDSPSPNATDRPRMTTPGTAFMTDYWTGRGGAGLASTKADTNDNPYAKAYACRSAYYMGSTRTEADRWSAGTFENWARTTTPRCP
ncbi:MAG: hypothetical protein RL199_468 [Pseudomonadota bacterium]|jgi:hypothetical protein